ncbi:MAG: hypothetical protein ACK57O_21720, partial [Planctomyces sp.]
NAVKSLVVGGWLRVSVLEGNDESCELRDVQSPVQAAISGMSLVKYPAVVEHADCQRGPRVRTKAFCRHEILASVPGMNCVLPSATVRLKKLKPIKLGGAQ